MSHKELLLNHIAQELDLIPEHYLVNLLLSMLSERISRRSRICRKRELCLPYTALGKGRRQQKNWLR